MASAPPSAPAQIRDQAPPAGSAGYVQPHAAWKVTLAGQDLTEKLAPRLASLRLTEARGEKADEFEIVLHDADGKLALPPEGARLQVQLGWARGTGVTPGLVDKGSFKVDEVSWSGPPDVVTITGRSADFKESFRTRKTRIFKDQTIGTIVGKIAAEHGLTARCHPDLAGKTVKAAEQHNKSDMQLLRDLGRRYDAVATTKDGALIFAPIDANTTATGKAIPTLELTRGKLDRYSFRRASRENGQDGAEAQWHDQKAGKRKKVEHGGAKRRRLKRVYASEGDAKEAAGAEAKRLKRAEATLELNLAYGDAAITAGVKAKAKGFKSEIDAKTWRVAKVEHRMDGQGGFVSQIEMEVAG
jgi:phage protein D